MRGTDARSRAAAVGWCAAGVIALAIHWPVTPVIGVALALPWLAVLLLLLLPATADAVTHGWTAAVGLRRGGWGAAVLGAVALAIVLLVAPGAVVPFLFWLAAAGSLLAVVRGGARLADALASWSVMAVTVAAMLLAAEAVLRTQRMAELLGTPAAIERWNTRYDHQWERNVLGIRSPHETLGRDEDMLRIIALGDSYTWGDKIADTAETWPAQLEAELSLRVPGRRVEVVNLARNGFTTANSAEMLRRLGWQFDPDIVILQYYLNDILPSGPDFERAYSGWLFPRAWLLPRRYRGGPLGSSALLHVAESAATSLRHGDRFARAERWDALYRSEGTEWRQLRDALHEMGAAARQRGVPALLVLFPDFVPGARNSEDLPFLRIHAQVTGAARAAGFTVLDLTDAYVREASDMREWWATAYDRHPSPAAARLAAVEIANLLAAAVPHVVPAELRH